MSIENTKVIDGLAYDDENKRICLLLADHLDWKDEYKHLMLLQEKLNAYAAFVQNKQYEQQFQKEEITSILIKEYLWERRFFLLCNFILIPSIFDVSKSINNY